MSLRAPFGYDAERLRACIGRRDRGEAPMPWDNYVLRRAREPINMRLPQPPTPAGSWRQTRVLAMLREGAATIERMKYALGCSEAQAHSVVDELRAGGWWIESVGPGEFKLVAQKRAA